ncbi:MAG: DUF4339 domain-containing protein [Salinarimonas sp.]|nr:DUF4339 domain-containing protein [Salinarimonas sp.]
MKNGSNRIRLFSTTLLALGLSASLGIAPGTAQTAQQPEAAAPMAAPVTSGGPPPLPVSPPPPLRTFYIAEGGEPVGPLNMGELRERRAAGTLTSDTLVWEQGMAEWGPAREVEGLASLFAEGTPETADDTGPDEVAEFDARTFLLGGWRTIGEVPIEGVGTGDADLTATYRDDGTLSVEGTITANLGMPTPTTISITSTGTWSVENINENRFFFSTTLTTTGTAPGMDLSEMEETETTSGLVDVLGPDSVRDSEGVIWTRIQL